MPKVKDVHAPEQYKVGAEYLYSAITATSYKYNMDVLDYGEFRVGENFIILKDLSYAYTASFVLIGITGGKDSMWRCCYSDWGAS